MADINTADDLAAYLGAIAKTNAVARGPNVWVSFAVDPDGLGIRCVGFKNGQTITCIVVWIEIILTNGEALQSAVTIINEELSAHG
jgi:hypothetical protein